MHGEEYTFEETRPMGGERVRGLRSYVATGIEVILEAMEDENKDTVVQRDSSHPRGTTPRKDPLRPGRDEPSSAAKSSAPASLQMSELQTGPLGTSSRYKPIAYGMFKLALNVPSNVEISKNLYTILYRRGCSTTTSYYIHCKPIRRTVWENWKCAFRPGTFDLRKTPTLGNWWQPRCNIA
jgi:hypothetical protein